MDSNNDSLGLDDFLKNMKAKQKPPQNTISNYFASTKPSTTQSKQTDSSNTAKPQTSALQPKKDLSVPSLTKKEYSQIPLPKLKLSLDEILKLSTEKIIPEEKTKLDVFGEKYRTFEGCKFCDIIHKNKDNKVIWQDDVCAAFHDKKLITAQAHILMCSKNHIKNIYCISKENIPLIIHIEEAGRALLQREYPGCEYRFGYHEPPMNSIEHLHLHCIVLPIASGFLNGVVYGHKLALTQEIIAKITSGEIIPGQYPEKVKKEKKPKETKEAKEVKETKQKKLEDVVDIIDDDM